MVQCVWMINSDRNARAEISLCGEYNVLKLSSTPILVYRAVLDRNESSNGRPEKEETRKSDVRKVEQTRKARKGQTTLWGPNFLRGSKKAIEIVLKMSESVGNA
jgi:hypothetical protein